MATDRKTKNTAAIRNQLGGDPLDDIAADPAPPAPESTGLIQVMFRLQERDRDAIRGVFARDGLTLSAGLRMMVRQRLRGDR